MGNLIKMVEYRKGAISVEYLKTILSYEPDTGIFRSLINRGARARAGNITGSLNAGGYVVIKIDRVQYLAHKLAVLYMTGKWPTHEVDHENTKTSDNRWVNLRQATHSQNTKNRSMNVNNSTAFKGVSKRGNRSRSKINCNGKQINLGMFDTPEEAHAAYTFASGFYHGEFANDGEA